MSVEQAIVAHLKADTAVTAIVSTRVYLLKLPQDPKLPAVRVQLISEPGSLHLRGVDSLYRSRVQVDALATEYDTTNPDPYGTVTELADAIDAALAGQAFDSSDSPMSCRVRQIRRDDRIPFYDAEERRQVRIVQDYFVWWTKVPAA